MLEDNTLPDTSRAESCLPVPARQKRGREGEREKSKSLESFIKAAILIYVSLGQQYSNKFQEYVEYAIGHFDCVSSGGSLINTADNLYMTLWHPTSISTAHLWSLCQFHFSLIYLSVTVYNALFLI